MNEGDFICVVGENGSGKSTLIRMVTGLIKPTSGAVRSGTLGRYEIGYLPQQAPVKNDFPASVTEVILTGRLNRKGFPPFMNRGDVRAAERNLEKLGILNLRRRSYRELSGGQRQRVLLARALCASERLLVLDEPVAGLDPLAQSEMYRIIGELNRDGLTILMVSHDVAGAIMAAGKILHMDGTTLFFGKTEDYLRSKPGVRFLSGAGAPVTLPEDADQVERSTSGAPVGLSEEVHPDKRPTSGSPLGSSDRIERGGPHV
jgi:zinc transport system ATP-binding protein